MPLLHVEMFEGRTPEMKAELAKALTEACTSVLGVSPESVDIVYRDVARHDWVSAGVPWNLPRPSPSKP